MSRRAPFALLLFALAAVAAGCGGSGSGDATVERPPLTSGQAATSTVATTTTATTPTTTPTPSTTATAPTTSATTTTANPGGASDSPPASSGGAPASCPDAVGGFVRDVRASGADCDRARSVGEAWFAAVHGGAAPDSQIAAAGYSCDGTLHRERADVTCKSSGGGTVAFTASP